MTNTLNQCEASKKSNPALEHSSCISAPPKFFVFKTQFRRASSSHRCSCMSQAVWGLNSHDPCSGYLLDNSCKGLFCVCTSSTHCLPGSYGTRTEMKTLPPLHTANRIRVNKICTSLLLDWAESFCTRILTKGLLQA